MRWSLVARRSIVIGAATVAVVAATATAASAHVEVTADKAQAGATDVTVTFHGEAESNSAGIKSEQVVLPAGITPRQVRLGKAPAGWAMTPTPDGFTVAGAALPVGTDAEFSIVIDKLPADATELAFKTIETYGDGEIARWIEIPKGGQAEPDNPAPILKLAAAAPVAQTTPAATPTAAPTTPPSPTPTAAAQETAGGVSSVLWIAIAAVLIVAAVVVALLTRRRRGDTSA